MEAQDLVRAIGITIGLFPQQIADILTKNAIVVDAENLNTDELVNATFSGLEKSVPFRNDFNDLFNENEELIMSNLKN